MGTNIKPEDLEFIRWLDSKDAEQFWGRDENGETVILRLGWDLAQKEYDRINGLKGKSENDLEVR